MVIDCHAHIMNAEEAHLGTLLTAADRAGVDRICISSLSRSWVESPTSEALEEAAQDIIEACEKYPDRFTGATYLSADHIETSLELLERANANGPCRFVKLWVSQFMDDPRLEPIYERAIELRGAVLAHTWIKATGNMRFESTCYHAVQVAQRHPDLRLWIAHCSGRWEEVARIVAPHENLCVDISGGEPEDGIVECLLRHISPQRVFFGSDAPGRSFIVQKSKVLSAGDPGSPEADDLGREHQTVDQLMIDFNAKLGYWPYRPVKTLDALLREMDRLGIDRAVVSSLGAVHYMNPQDGNDELVRAIAAHRDRIMPFAVLKPNFAAVADDLDRCLGEFGMKGLVLYPNYHRFRLDDPGLEALLDRARATRIPVCIQAGLEDPRRQYDREILNEVPPETIGAFARECPGIPVVALGLKWREPERMGDPLPDNLHFDTSNYETMGALEKAAAQFGSDRILLGTNFPLFNPQANIDKVRLADLPEADRTAIARGNAEALLQ